MATIFAAFGKTLGNNKGSIQNFGIVGITIATEEISKFIFFYCPCDYPRNQTYGSIFIWGPGAVLLIAGYLANRRTWRLTTGLCHRTQTIGRGGKRIFHFLFIFLSVGGKSMIAPATWVVLAFLKGDYYACAHWPDPFNDLAHSREFYQLDERNGTVPLPRPCIFNPNPAKFSATKEAEIIARTLRAESHIIGWFYLTIGMLLSVIFMFCMRCRSNFSYEQYNYIDRYRVHEIELFENKLDEKAKEQADRIVNGYFSKPRAKEDWDKIAVINDKVTRSKRGKAIYSPLHRYVNKEFIRKQEENENGEICLDLVQDAAMKKKKKPMPAGNANVSGSSTRAPTTPAPAVIQMVPIVTPKSKTVIVQANPPATKKEDMPPPKPAPSKNTETSQSTGTGTNVQQTIAPGSKDTKAENVSPQLEPSSGTKHFSSQQQQVPDKTTDEAQPNNDDRFTAPSETTPLPTSSTTAVEPGITNVGRHSPTAPPTTTSPSQKQRPQSFPSSVSPLAETSLGDFGGYYSREDLRKSLSSNENIEECDQGPVDHSKTFSDQEVSENIAGDEECEPLLKDDDEPLLTKDV